LNSLTVEVQAPSGRKFMAGGRKKPAI